MDVNFIQETKLRGLELGVVKELWGDDKLEWYFTDANGASGGMLIMWKRDYFLCCLALKENVIRVCVCGKGW